MPASRSRRAGYRPGKLSAAVRASFKEEAERLAALDDPVEIVRGVGDAFAAMDVELERLAVVRLVAIRKLREQGWSYDRIAAATDLSKGRVAQLARDRRR